MGALALGSVLACGKKGGDSPSSEGTNTPSTDGGGQVALPEPPAAAGQLILTLDTGVDPSTVSGYVVGKQDLLKIERAKSGEYFIHNVPAGTHDVVVVASTSGASLWNTLLLKSDKSPDVGVRLNKVEVLNGIRTKKEKVKLPSLISVAGNVTLSNQTDHAGIDVYIPGTEYVAKTDSKGAFSFAGVPTGTHNFFFERDGYVRGQMEGVDVDKEPAQSLDAMTLLVDTGTEGFMVLNEGAAVSASKEVKVTLGAGSDSVVMKISENPDFAGAPWKALKTTFTYKFQTGGNKILFAKIANANGLESSPFSAQVLIATQEPELTLSVSALNCRDVSLVLNVGAVSGSAPSQMKVSSTGNLEGAAWEPFAATKSITRNAISGPIVVRLKDGFGREKQGQLNQYSCLATLSRARSNLASISVGTKVFFAGGIIYPGVSDLVEVFDIKTGLWEYSKLSQARGDLSVQKVGTDLLFAGGTGPSSVVDIFNSASSTWNTSSLSRAGYLFSSTGVGNKTFFAGGSGSSSVVEVYNSATGIWATDALSQGRSFLAATSLGSRALFAGGIVSAQAGSSAVVDIFDSESGNWSVGAISIARHDLAAASAGNRAFFAGGTTDQGISNVVDIYSSSSGQWATAALSEARSSIAGISAGTKVFFAGGNGVAGPSNTVDVFDTNSDSWSNTLLSQARWGLSATNVGTKAIFAGGYTGTEPSNVIDIYDTATNTWSNSLKIDLNQL